MKHATSRITDSTISDLRVQWQALSSDLEVLDLRDLTNKQLRLFLQIRPNPMSPHNHKILRKALPISIAKFKEAAQKEIYERVQTKTSLYAHHQDELFAQITDAFGRDIAKNS